MTSIQRDPKVAYVHTKEGDLHYMDWQGIGPQVHILHANGFCAGTYTPLIEKLNGQLHMFASDLRGHGNTLALPKYPIRHWQIFANDLKDVIEGVMTPPIIGVGHSLGAVCTFIAAGLYPHLFSGIVMMDPVILPVGKLRLLTLLRFLGLSGKVPLAKGARRRRKVFAGKKQALERFMSGRGIFKRWSPEFIEAYLECGLLEKDRQTAVLKCDPELEAQIYESVPTNIWTYATQIRCPVLVIRGEHSDVFKMKSAVRLKHLIPNCQIETITQAGHFVPMEQPHTCARHILTFATRYAIQS
jgi:pimeloyl-ACP methyl ester carboxylesterase